MLRFRTFYVWAGVLALVGAGCATETKVPAPRVAATQQTSAKPVPPPHPPLEPAPPLWSGNARSSLTAEGVTINAGERAVGDVLTQATYVQGRTGKLGHAITVPGREDLNLSAGQPLHAENIQFIRQVISPNIIPPPINSWYWCARPDNQRTVCMAWLSEGRVRIARAPNLGELFVVHDPEQNWVEIAEPQIIDAPIDYPSHIRRRVLTEIRADGLVISETSEEGSNKSSRATRLLPWDTPKRLDEKVELRFEPVKAADGTVRGVTMTSGATTEKSVY